MGYLFSQLLALFKSNRSVYFGAIVISIGSIFIVLSLSVLLRSFVHTSYEYFNQEHYSIFLKHNSKVEDLEYLKGYLNNVKEGISYSVKSNADIRAELMKSLNVSDLPTDIELFSNIFSFSLSQPSKAEKTLVEAIGQFPFVESLLSNNGITVELNNFLSKSRIFFIFVILLVSIGLILAVYIVQQLLVYSFAPDLKVMSSLGASRYFILRPFIINSLLVSISSFLVSFSLLMIGVELINRFSKESGFSKLISGSLVLFTANEVLIIFCGVVFLAITSSYLACIKVLQKLET